MHILIATDGTLDVELAIPYVRNLAGADPRLTVMTVIEVNRSLIRDLRSIFGEQGAPRTDQDAEYVGLQTSAKSVSPSWPGDDEMLQRYLEDQAQQRTAPLVAALRDAGLDPEIEALDGEDAASVIIKRATELDADAIVVGSHGRGVFDGLLGSTGTKLARRSPCPVLVLRD